MFWFLFPPFHFRMDVKPLPDVLPATEFNTNHHGYQHYQGHHVSHDHPNVNGNGFPHHPCINYEPTQQLTSPKVVKAAVTPVEPELSLSRPPTPPPRMPSSKQSVAANRPVSFGGSGSGFKHYHGGHQQHLVKPMVAASPPLARGRAFEPHPKQNHVIEVPQLMGKQVPLKKVFKENPSANGQLFVRPMGPREIAGNCDYSIRILAHWTTTNGLNFIHMWKSLDYGHEDCQFPCSPIWWQF